MFVVYLSAKSQSGQIRNCELITTIYNMWKKGTEAHPALPVDSYEFTDTIKQRHFTQFTSMLQDMLQPTAGASRSLHNSNTQNSHVPDDFQQHVISLMVCSLLQSLQQEKEK